MKQIVYISEYLKNTVRGKPVYNALKNLEKDKEAGFELKEIPSPLHNKNEWCRDYMPVRNAKNELILFEYNPSYLREYKTHRETIPDQEKICNELKLKVIHRPPRIILDGGAVEVYGGKAIISDRVLSENTTSWKHVAPEVLSHIQDKLKVKELIVVPADPWDFTGHVDGLVRFINETEVLINDFSLLDLRMENENDKVKMVYEKWKMNFLASLESANLKTFKLPYIIRKDQKDESAVGVYMNFLKLDNCIIMPSFDDEENDIKAQEILYFLYKRPVYKIEATELARKGGVINCVTWDY